MKKTIWITMFLMMVGLTLSSFDITKNYTRLTITIIDELGNKVEGATVKLYKEKEDYDKLTNEYKVTTTDKKGRAYFTELEAISYYVYAEKDDMNNLTLGEKTSVLEEDKHNKANIVIAEF